jgi:TRAP-type C4-dicarboxylate transport system permease small subunit
MRRFLDRLYRASGALAAIFLVAICVVVLLQVGANLIDIVSFFLAAASFLALAYTLRCGGHIRVSLVISHLGGAPRRAMELVCILIAAAISAYFTWFMLDLVIESFRYEDVSPGMVPVKLWIPQTSLALGLLVLVIALIDEFVSVLCGARPSYEANGDHPGE